MSTTWKQDMDALYEATIKNWENTGKVRKASGVSGSINLSGPGEPAASNVGEGNKNKATCSL